MGGGKSSQEKDASQAEDEEWRNFIV